MGDRTVLRTSIEEHMGLVRFTDEFAYVSIAPVPEAAKAVDGKYTFKPAWQQCMERLMAYPPSSFHAVLRGTNLSPHVDVVIRQSSLHSIPLLSDIWQEALADNFTKSVEVPFEPPCSVWSLVSVMLLLEGDVTIDFWLGAEEHDVSLAAQTLEVRPRSPNHPIMTAYSLVTIITIGSCPVAIISGAAATSQSCFLRGITRSHRRAVVLPCEHLRCTEHTRAVSMRCKRCLADGRLPESDFALQRCPAMAPRAHRGVPQHWTIKKTLAQQ
jgi:hypothetical protein